MNRDTAALRHFDLLQYSFKQKAFQPQFLLNENFNYLDDIAKDTEFFF